MCPETTEARQSPGITWPKLTPAPRASTSEADVLHVYQCLPLDTRKLSGTSSRYLDASWATPENKTSQVALGHKNVLRTMAEAKAGSVWSRFYSKVLLRY